MLNQLIINFTHVLVPIVAFLFIMFLIDVGIRATLSRKLKKLDLNATLLV